jgi:hypothetical protein
MDSLKPKIQKINHFKFYNLDELGWSYVSSKESIKFNKPILQEIARDFSDHTGIDFSRIMKVFGTYIVGRSSDRHLLLYTNRGLDTVYYYFTNSYSETYEELNPE